MRSIATVWVIQNKKQHELPVNGAPDVLTILQRSRFTITAPCGGSGTCGKCLVRVVGGDPGEPRKMERRLLSAERLAAGTRFACLLAPDGEMTIEIPDWHAQTQHKATPVSATLENDPQLVKRTVRLAAPSIEDQKPDLERVIDACNCTAHRLSAASLQSLAAAVRREDYQVTALVSVEDENHDQLLALESGDTSAVLWGVAVDIGTTTVAAYLVNLANARATDVYSELNEQIEFGADVVTRISHSQKHGVGPVQHAIVSQINHMIAVLAERNNLSPADIYLTSVTGNTTMLHFFAGLDPAAIGVSPFIPVTTSALSFRAAELAITINPEGIVNTLPGISGYVGADVVAAIIASRIRESNDISLLIDIGTNGEIVLGNSDWLTACSTAAGPAFEGAQIRFGVGGIDGAVNSFALSHNGSRDGNAGIAAAVCTTINSAPATGICGSGMLDVVAALLRTGAVDETGRLLPQAELPATVPSAIRERCGDFDAGPAFMVVAADQTHDGESIYLTEHDVRELQLAKAAIAAGIDTLLHAADIQIGEVSAVYLAGGFGSYMNAENALAIGLIPPQVRGRVEVIGNAAGIGAVMSMTSRSVSRQCRTAARNVRYIELSSSPAFQTAYIENMGFGG